MGDLLDEGLIVRSDLAWAAKTAYKEQIKAAARILLAELDKALTAPPAALTAPPAAPLARPAAPLARGTGAVAQVATADESAAPRYGPRVVTASTYLADQQEMSFGMLAFTVGISFIAVFTTLSTIVSRGFQGSWPGIAEIGSLFLVAGLAVFFIRKYGIAWRNTERGRRGEEQIVDALRSSLDSRWTIYRNLQLADKHADFDVVLVGTGGVWIVQVKNYRASLRYRNGWQRKQGRQWVALDDKFDPEKQVKRQATQLNEYLAKQGITRWVECAIALAEPVAEKDVADSQVPVWLPFNIAQQARSLTTRTPPSRAEVEQINALLARRADEQRAVEADRQKHNRA